MFVLTNELLNFAAPKTSLASKIFSTTLRRPSSLASGLAAYALRHEHLRLRAGPYGVTLTGPAAGRNGREHALAARGPPMPRPRPVATGARRARRPPRPRAPIHRRHGLRHQDDTCPPWKPVDGFPEFIKLEQRRLNNFADIPTVGQGPRVRQSFRPSTKRASSAPGPSSAGRRCFARGWRAKGHSRGLPSGALRRAAQGGAAARRALRRRELGRLAGGKDYSSTQASRASRMSPRPARPSSLIQYMPLILSTASTKVEGKGSARGGKGWRGARRSARRARSRRRAAARRASSMPTARRRLCAARRLRARAQSVRALGVARVARGGLAVWPLARVARLGACDARRPVLLLGRREQRRAARSQAPRLGASGRACARSSGASTANARGARGAGPPSARARGQSLSRYGPAGERKLSIRERPAWRNVTGFEYDHRDENRRMNNFADINSYATRWAWRLACPRPRPVPAARCSGRRCFGGGAATIEHEAPKSSGYGGSHSRSAGAGAQAKEERVASRRAREARDVESDERDGGGAWEGDGVRRAQLIRWIWMGGDLRAARGRPRRYSRLMCVGPRYDLHGGHTRTARGL